MNEAYLNLRDFEGPQPGFEGRADEILTEMKRTDRNGANVHGLHPSGVVKYAIDVRNGDDPDVVKQTFVRRFRRRISAINVGETEQGTQVDKIGRIIMPNAVWEGMVSRLNAEAKAFAKDKNNRRRGIFIKNKFNIRPEDRLMVLEDGRSVEEALVQLYMEEWVPTYYTKKWQCLGYDLPLPKFSALPTSREDLHNAELLAENPGILAQACIAEDHEAWQPLFDMDATYQPDALEAVTSYSALPLPAKLREAVFHPESEYQLSEEITDWAEANNRLKEGDIVVFERIITDSDFRGSSWAKVVRYDEKQGCIVLLKPSGEVMTRLDPGQKFWSKPKGNEVTINGGDGGKFCHSSVVANSCLGCCGMKINSTELLLRDPSRERKHNAPEPVMGRLISTPPLTTGCLSQNEWITNLRVVEKKG